MAWTGSGLPTNKTVILNMWASWCLFCREEMPILQDIHEHYARQCRLDVVGVNQQDSEASAQAYLRSVGITYTNVFDPDSALSLRLPPELRAAGLPSTIVVGPDRQPRAFFPGAVTFSQLRSAINDASGRHCMDR